MRWRPRERYYRYSTSKSNRLRLTDVIKMEFPFEFNFFRISLKSILPDIRCNSFAYPEHMYNGVVSTHNLKCLKKCVCIMLLLYLDMKTYFSSLSVRGSLSNIYAYFFQWYEAIFLSKWFHLVIASGFLQQICNQILKVVFI